MRLGSEVVDFIRPYSFDGSFDGFVFEELQRYRLDGRRYHRRARATITTKNTIAQSQKVLAEIVSILPCDARNQGFHFRSSSIGVIPRPTMKFQG